MERDLLCFHTRKTWREDVLGFGLNVDRRNNRVSEVSALMDLIGWSAYRTQNVRLGVMSGTSFTDWIPLFIHEDHASRAFPLLRQQVAAMYGANSFHPEMGFDLVTKMMNYFVVAIFKLRSVWFCGVFVIYLHCFQSSFVLLLMIVVAPLWGRLCNASNAFAVCVCVQSGRRLHQ